MSPFFVNYGYHPRMGVEPRREVKVQLVEDFVSKMQKVQEEVEAPLKKARDDMMRHVDRTRAHTPEYKVGDLVWLSTKDLNIPRPSRKFTEKQVGPYAISKVILPNAVVVKFP